MRSAASKTKGRKPSGFALLAMLVVFAPGCSICCQPHLDDYVAFGSRTPRSNMKMGRVGSPFSDPSAGASVSGASHYGDQGGEVYYEGEYEGAEYQEGAEYYGGAVVGESQEIYFEGE